MARTLGLGTVIAVDDDDSGSVFTTISLAVTATPPGRRRERIPATALADTFATTEPGIELESEYSFEHYYEPNETNGNLITTLFANKTKVLWQITYASSDVEAFEGWVSDIEVMPIVTNELLKRRVTIQRSGSISYT